MTSSHDLASPPSSHAGTENLRVERSRALTRHINPFDSEHPPSFVVGALCQVSDGAEWGFTLANEWYCSRSDYPGNNQLLLEWNEIHKNPNCVNGFEVLCALVTAAGFDSIEVCASIEPGFERCHYLIVAEPETQLTQYSLAGQLEVLERDAVEQVLILGGLALLGQSTNFYSSPNVGKTLLMLWLLIATIMKGVIDPSKVFYLNVDDSLMGLLEKLRLAEEFGFHMLTEGYRGFRTIDFTSHLIKMIERDECHGVVIIIDVMKKFTDPMSKRISSGFWKVVRRFVLKGGTFISLAHTNKRPGPDGKPIYGGTSDSLEDVDAAYTLQVTSDLEAREKIVAFECIKRRGNVRQRAFYGYCAEEGISYEQLFASVRPIADGEQAEIEHLDELKSDAEMIAIARTCIQEGIVTKMLLAGTIARRSGCSKRSAIKLLEKYTGIDAGRHMWTFEVMARGAKTFRLLEISEIDSPEKD